MLEVRPFCIDPKELILQEFKNLFEKFLSLIRSAFLDSQGWGKRFRATLLGIVVMPLWLGLIPVAQAASCHSVNDRTICIVEIKRSAKYPWEYRVSLSQDGVKQPQELYNCRDRVRVGADGVAVPFAAEGNGEWICRRLKRN
ncbi:hypothetical protein [Leptolyngbya ohadii]|uniref:hypothetical protein n=1 Tax=Leptolyngbya ohadii TaxID=1962290 RepID=UPI0019D4A144|nr:hypothetical protein [Leptolyngbya ohadii]